MYRINFEQGKSIIKENLFYNEAMLNGAKLQIEKALADSTLISLSFSATVSPEGRIDFNRQLAQDRHDVLKAYLKSHVTIDPEYVIDGYTGVDWDGLIAQVKGSGMPYEQEILKILIDEPEYTRENGVLVGSRKKSLQDLAGGKAWNILYDSCFSDMRASSVIVTTKADDGVGGVVIIETPRELKAAQEAATTPRCLPRRDTVYIHSVDTVYLHSVDTVYIPLSKERKPFYMSVKTNMLYDLALVPNVEVEFYLGGNVSLNADWMYSWWKTDVYHYYWRIYGGDLGLRYWLGRASRKKPLTWHHIGAFAQIVTYDFELGDRGIQGPKWSYGGSLEYGFSLPVAERLNLDFTLGAGYITGKYYEYIPIDEHYVWQATYNRQYFGPTKLEVSLVYLIGHDNYNRRGKK